MNINPRLASLHLAGFSLFLFFVALRSCACTRPRWCPNIGNRWPKALRCLLAIFQNLRNGQAFARSDNCEITPRALRRYDDTTVWIDRTAIMTRIVIETSRQVALMNHRPYRLYRDAIYGQLSRASCRSFVHRAKRISLTPPSSDVLLELCF